MDIIKRWLTVVDEFFEESGEVVAENQSKADKNSDGIHEEEKKDKKDGKTALQAVNGRDKGGLAFEKRNNGEGGTQSKSGEIRRIGVHCVAGLGRAAFFVAIALVNNGCTPQNAIELIRSKRSGAINMF